jgi:16S rRNA (cytidine1402-2'-O)-methyltransferase
MASADAKKRKSWPAFASWVQDLFQASQDDDASKPFALEPALYLVSTPIGNLGDITLRALWVLRQAGAVLCEDTRVTGGLLHHYGIKQNLISCHDHNEEARAKDVQQRLAGGQALALVSDAGTPMISDPGYKLVQACRAAGFPIIPVPGACAAITALTMAGLPTDRFLFAGFLPAKQTARRQALRTLETVQATLVFYESPQRLADTLEDMCAILGDAREAAVGRELTKLYEDMQNGSLHDLSATYQKAENPKGEVVILIGPPAEGAPASAADLDAALRQALETMSIRDAAATVSGALGLKKNVVYQRALALADEL